MMMLLLGIEGKLARARSSNKVINELLEKKQGKLPDEVIVIQEGDE